jgi:endoglucanase
MISRRHRILGLGALLTLGCGTDRGGEPTERVRARLSSPGFHTDGAQIRAPDGTVFHVDAVNWYGFETRNAVAQGLWAADYRLVVDQVAQYGFNTIRIPFSNEMWETNPVARNNLVGACPDCSGKTARDVLALIINYAGSRGLHVILDNHRSAAGNSAESNGLWYTSAHPEAAWINDWRQILAWVNGSSSFGAPLDYLAADGKPIVLGLDLRNEPHTPGNGPSSSYLAGATWGSGDGIDPASNPNPNPFAPACVQSST